MSAASHRHPPPGAWYHEPVEASARRDGDVPPLTRSAPAPDQPAPTDLRASIIIPTLNAPGIQRTLASLQEQRSRTAWHEIIAVGRDEPGLIAPFPGLVWRDTERPMAPAAARNLGVGLATGDLLCFLDADCEAAPDWLATMQRAFDDPATTIVGGGVAFDNDRYWTLADNIATFYPYLSTAPPGRRDQLPSLNLCLRRAVWNEVGGFDERYPFPAAEDSDWCLRARQAGHTLRFEPRAMVWHRPSRGSARELWRHAVRFGSYSVKVDSRYDQLLGRPWVLRHWLPLLAASPALAAAVTARAYRDRVLWPHLRALPAVYLAKLGWCWGAAGTLRHGTPRR